MPRTQARGPRPGLPCRGFSLGRERGFTLLETSAVLVVSAIIGAAVMVGFAGANESERTLSSMTELDMIRTTIADLYRGQGDFSGLNNASVNASNSFPAKWMASGQIVNAFGGKVDINQYGDLAYSVQYSGMPASACVKMLSARMPADLALLFTHSGPQDIGSPSGGSSQGRFTPRQAETACLPAKGDGTTEVTWVFGDPAASSAGTIAVGAANSRGAPLDIVDSGGSAAAVPASSAGTTQALGYPNPPAQTSSALSPAPPP